MSSVVVFPAPFGPTSPKKLPAGTSRETSATASVCPERLVQATDAQSHDVLTGLRTS